MLQAGAKGALAPLLALLTGVGGEPNDANPYQARLQWEYRNERHSARSGDVSNDVRERMLKAVEDIRKAAAKHQNESGDAKQTQPCIRFR